MWNIGNIKINSKVVLAPMAGVSNPSYIKICEEMGAGYAVSELLSAEAIVRNNQKTLEMLKGIEKLQIPIGIQIFGSNPKTMAQAAQILTKQFKIKIIDINMGCPVPKVAIRSNAGAALLKVPHQVKEIVQEVVKAVSVPVTVKIRSGWDKNSLNAVLISKIIEESGAKAIAIHGRTRSQGYTGSVDYEIIKKVKEAVHIPVIGNGDIVDIESAKRMLATGVDALMVGRGCLGNPWLIKELNAYLNNKEIISKPSYQDKINMCFKHLNYLLEIKPERVSVLEMRSHISWYLKGLPNSIDIKNKIFKATTKDELESILNDYLKELEKLS